MNKMIGALSIAVMMVGSAMAGADEAQAVKKQTTCPVMGGAVKTNLYVDYEGKRIYACCKGCLPDLKKDPAKYVAKLEKAGITLDKADAGGK